MNDEAIGTHQVCFSIIQDERNTILTGWFDPLTAQRFVPLAAGIEMYRVKSNNTMEVPDRSICLSNSRELERSLGKFIDRCSCDSIGRSDAFLLSLNLAIHGNGVDTELERGEL